jgi:hypothetical protein
VFLSADNIHFFAPDFFKILFSTSSGHKGHTIHVDDVRAFAGKVVYFFASFVDTYVVCFGSDHLSTRATCDRSTTPYSALASKEYKTSTRVIYVIIYIIFPIFAVIYLFL